MRDAIQRNRIERRIALAFFVALLALAALFQVGARWVRHHDGAGPPPAAHEVQR